jgi:hypothetical protein
MPTYTLTGPDGVEYDVDADNEQAALHGFMQHQQMTGVTPQSHTPGAKPSTPSAGQNAWGTVKEFGKGVVDGVASANPLDIGVNIGGYINQKIADITGIAPPEHNLLNHFVSPDAMRGVRGVVQDHLTGPVDPSHSTARTVGDFVGAAAAPGAALRSARALPEVLSGARSIGNAATNIGAGAARDVAVGAGGAGAAIGAGAGGKYVGQTVGDMIDPSVGRVLGEVLGTAGEVGGGIFGGRAAGGVANTMSPQAPRPGYSSAVDRLRDAGVPMTAGQETGNTSLRAAEDVATRFPLGSQAQETLATQGGNFNRAMMRTAGHEITNPEGLMTPEEWVAAKDGFRQRYGDLTSRNTLVADQQMLDDVSRVGQGYTRDVAPSSQNGVVQKWLDDLYGNGQQMLPGDVYQQWYSDLGRDIRKFGGIGGHGPTVDALTEIRQALSDNMGRSMLPQDSAAWNALNRQYSNYKTIQKAAAGATGESAATGLLSPQRLRAAAASKDGAARLEGRSDVGNLAEAGEAVLTPPRSSGTAERLSAQNLGLSTPGALLGSAIGTAMGSPLLGGAIGGAAPAIVKYLRSTGPMQSIARGVNGLTPLPPGPVPIEMIQQHAPLTAGLSSPVPVDVRR